MAKFDGHHRFYPAHASDEDTFAAVAEAEITLSEVDEDRDGCPHVKDFPVREEEREKDDKEVVGYPEHFIVRMFHGHRGSAEYDDHGDEDDHPGAPRVGREEGGDVRVRGVVQPMPEDVTDDTHGDDLGNHFMKLDVFTEVRKK